MAENKPDATAAVAQSQEPGSEPAATPGSGLSDPFHVGDGLRRSDETRPYVRRSRDPIYRPLKIFTLDPSISRLEGAIATLKVPYEQLRPGPCGAVFEVDNDDGFQRNQRVDLDDPFLLMNDGIDPTPSDPRFHQQMVYAVASSVYAAFHSALGRHVTWSFARPATGNRARLMLRPHALKNTRNAFYDKTTGSIQFGYFRADRKVSGRTLPGSWVFSCLSHDIVAHEVTHAILDGLRANFTVPTNPDVAGFHEAFADLIAVFQHFSYNEVMTKAIAKSRGNLQLAPLLTELAWQFSQAQEGNHYGQALRSAVSERRGRAHGKSRRQYRESLEPHALGAVLVAAIFEAFSTVYDRKASRFIRLATGGSGVLPEGELSPHLISALADQASHLASQFLSICIRAVDYCPPVDLYFGEYLRALITADFALIPDDPWGYREALIDAFRLHGIFPTDVPNLSEDALLWLAPEEALPPCPELDFAALKFRGDPSLPANQQELERQASALGRFVTYPGRGRLMGLVSAEEAARDGFTFEPPCIHSVRSTRRVGPQGQIVFDLVAEVTQRRLVELPGKGKFPMYGGATVIIDPDGRIRYSIAKGIRSRYREAQQRDYISAQVGKGLWVVEGNEAVPQPEMFRFLHDADQGATGAKRSNRRKSPGGRQPASQNQET